MIRSARHPLLPITALALLATGIGASASASAEDDGFPGVRSLMTVEEFEAAGLDELSDAQIEALDTWLIRYTADDAAVVSETSPEVREARRSSTIESRIVGEFTGWNGDTVFELENGQVWRQRLDGRFTYRGPPNPAVQIKRNFAGFFQMRLVEAGRGVGVTRVR